MEKKKNFFFLIVYISHFIFISLTFVLTRKKKKTFQAKNIHIHCLMRNCQRFIDFINFLKATYSLSEVLMSLNLPRGQTNTAIQP
jgi:hypothetical protein